MQMTRISVPVTIAEREELQADAQRQMRHPREHARYLLRQALGIAEVQQVESSDNAQSDVGDRQVKEMSLSLESFCPLNAKTARGH
jgi:hypothetical protein